MKRFIFGILCCFLIFLSSVHCLESFGQEYTIYDSSSLTYAWEYWGWDQNFFVEFTAAVENSRVMDVRVNYTEGCFSALTCPQVTLNSIRMDMTNVNRTINQDETLIFVIYNFSDMMNVDIDTLELKISNLAGNIQFASLKSNNYHTIEGLLPLSTFLGVESLVFTLVGNRLPSRFNYTMGDSVVSVQFKQQDYFSSSSKDIELVFHNSEPNNYSLVNVESSLQDYYTAMCYDNRIYRWIDTISFISKSSFSSRVELTYQLKVLKDYFGFSVEDVNLKEMKMTELFHGISYLRGYSVSNVSLSVDNFNSYSPNTTISVIGPLKYFPITQVESNNKIFNSVSKGQVKIFNIKVNVTDLEDWYFKYQVTSQYSLGFFRIQNV